MTIPPAQESVLSSISSLIAIIAFCYAIVAYFLNNRRKSSSHKRTLRNLLVVRINRDFKSTINEALKGSYSEIKDNDVRDIVSQFDNDEKLFVALPGVSETLVEYLDLADEVVFMRRLEKTTAISVFIFILVVALVYTS